MRRWDVRIDLLARDFLTVGAGVAVVASGPRRRAGSTVASETTAQASFTLTR
jgi:hypothetical protein